MPFRIASRAQNAAQTYLAYTATSPTRPTRFQGIAPLNSRTSLRGVAAGRVEQLTGNGVRVAAVAQQFAQGSIGFTDSNLDLAVSGWACSLSNSPARLLTRAPISSIATATWSTRSSSVCRPIHRWRPADSTPAASATCNCRPRIRRRAPRPASNTCSISRRTPRRRLFDPANPNTFNQATSLTRFHSLGATQTARCTSRRRPWPNLDRAHVLSTVPPSAARRRSTPPTRP